jgi:hypothetical protein
LFQKQLAAFLAKSILEEPGFRSRFEVIFRYLMISENQKIHKFFFGFFTKIK